MLSIPISITELLKQCIQGHLEDLEVKFNKFECILLLMLISITRYACNVHGLGKVILDSRFHT